MAKPKKKKVEIEENEFLKGLIDEVKSFEENSVVDSDEESSADEAASVGIKIHHEEKEKRALGVFEQTRSRVSSPQVKIPEDHEMPTVFRGMKDVMKNQPKVDLHQDSEKEEPVQEKVVSEKSKAPKFPPPIDSPVMPKVAPVVDAAEEIPDEPVLAEDLPNVPVAQSQISSSIGPNEKTQLTADASAQVVPPQMENSRTIAVEGARGGAAQRFSGPDRVVAGSLKGTRSGQVYTSLDASLAQAETLKMAQDRIHELETECDHLRRENEQLASASEVVTRRLEEIQVRLNKLQKQRSELAEQAKSEQLILKGHLQYKDSELAKAKLKIEDLESRLKSDFRKIRVRERELENRLELVRAEKQALMRSKDEKILDLQRKLDQFKSELDLYRTKVQDLNKSMEEQQEQMKKTVRALRVALSNLEQDELSKILAEGSETGLPSEGASESEGARPENLTTSQSDDDDSTKQDVG
ncbi:MAG: hypothetical protein ACK5Y2_05205 [Bdellovibrionales bacterium]